jgi:hypothetical protein
MFPTLLCHSNEKLQVQQALMNVTRTLRDAGAELTDVFIVHTLLAQTHNYRHASPTSMWCDLSHSWSTEWTSVTTI